MTTPSISRSASALRTPDLRLSNAPGRQTLGARFGMSALRSRQARLVHKQLAALQLLWVLDQLGVLPAGRVAPAQAPQGTTAARPANAANGIIADERARLQREKYTFKPEEQAKVDKFNAERAKENAKHAGEAMKVQGEMAKVASSTKLSPKDKAKKLRELAKKHREITDKIKPPVCLHTVTAEIDKIMQDDSIPADKKKDHVEKIRKKYGIPESNTLGMAPVNMHDLFTGRMGKLTKKSKERIEKKRKAMGAQLKTQLRAVENTYGPNSPQAVALKREIEEVDKTLKTEEKKLESEAKALEKMYKPPGFFDILGKIFGAIFKVFDFLMPLLKLIPGVGQIVGAIYSGVKALGSLISGDPLGALKNLAGAIPVVGETIGSAASAVASKVGDLVSKGGELLKKGIDTVKSGFETVSAIARGDVGGALQGVAGVAGDVGAPSAVTDAIGVAQRGVAAVERAAAGDVAGALGQAGGIADDLGGAAVGDVLSKASEVAAVGQKAATGDVLGAVSDVAELESAPDEIKRVARTIDDGVQTVREGAKEAFEEVLERTHETLDLARLGDANDYVDRIYTQARQARRRARARAQVDLAALVGLDPA